MYMKLGRLEYRYRCFKEEIGALIEFNFIKAAKQTNGNIALQLWEVLWGWLRYGVLPKSYYNYRLYEDPNPIKLKIQPYISDRVYFSKLGTVNLDYSILLNSKWVFHNFFDKHNIPLPRCWGYLHRHGGIWAETGTTYSFNEIPSLFQKLDGHRIVLKPNKGSGGFKVTVADVRCQGNDCLLYIDNSKVPLKDYMTNFMEHDYIVEEHLKQHEVLNKIYPHAVNTVRIITLNDSRRPIIWGAIIKVGVNNALIDNWGYGSLCVGIEMNSGRLLRGSYDIGYTKSITPPLTIHPNTNVHFEEITLPYWQELKETVCNAASLVGGLPYIAWDVAITPDGPCIVEGNGRSDLSMVQTQGGGLKKPEIRQWWKQYNIDIV